MIKHTGMHKVLVRNYHRKKQKIAPAVLYQPVLKIPLV
jgi:hypothetical protein